MAAMALMPALPGGGFSDLFTNRVFLAGFWGWFTAQTLKVRRTYHTPGVKQEQQHMFVMLSACDMRPWYHPLSYSSTACQLEREQS